MVDWWWTGCGNFSDTGDWRGDESSDDIVGVCMVVLMAELKQKVVMVVMVIGATVILVVLVIVGIVKVITMVLGCVLMVIARRLCIICQFT